MKIRENISNDFKFDIANIYNFNHWQSLIKSHII
jgi:hypothetical protein